ncbi:MAG TPA: hypothetical protein PLD73_05440 [Candidatus Hydrogenedentes bacterium]|jgi:hypothetical protein|nr:hypothetical protein [Candidatus Hydrogenedentota bacterium]HPJ98244.1 hypothetical protein [Candidatus Hydrogenedentota bacterium]
MIENKVVKILTWWMTGLCVWAFASGAQEAVLCLGANGHVAIESAHSAPCNIASEAPDDQGSRISGIREHYHSSCVDILFPQQSELAPEDNHKAASKSLETHLAVACESVSEAELAASTAIQPIQSHPLELLSARTLRSTILLI